MSPARERGLIVGGAAFAGALLLLGATFVRALTARLPEPPAPLSAAAAPEVSPVATPVEEAMNPPAVPQGEVSPSTASTDKPLSMDALALAADNDPFQQDRRRPAERYVLPADRVTEEPPPEPPPPPPFRIIGTALNAEGGLAVVQVEEMTPRVIALGEGMLGYTLESVDGESATLVGDGRTLTLPVTAAPPPEPRRTRPGARGRGAQPDARETRERQVDVLEAIRRQMLERGGATQDIQIENGRVIIRPRVNRDTLDARDPRVP
jgi:hypothetical protein